MGIFLYFFFLKFSIFAVFIVSVLSSIPFIYLSNISRTELISFCDVNSTDFPICHERITNTSNWLNAISCENFRIYKNITEQILIRNNNTYVSYPGWDKFDYNLISFVTQLILFVVYLIIYNNIYNQAGEVDFMNLTPSDYTLMISELKNNYKTKDELQKFLETVKNL